MNKSSRVFVILIVLLLVALNGCVSNVIETEFEANGVLSVVPMGEGSGNSTGPCFSSDLNEVFMFNLSKGSNEKYFPSYPIEPNDELRRFFGQEVFIKGKIVEIKITGNMSCVKVVVDKINWVVK